MRRKPVVKLLRSIVKLRAILRTSKSNLARRLKSHVGRRPPAPRDQHFCYRPLFWNFDVHLTILEQLLAGAEDVYACNKLLAGHLRRQRNRARSSLHRRQSHLRLVLSALPGAGDRLECYGISGATPEAGPELIWTAERTLDLLGTIDPAAPELVVAIKLDVAALTRGLRTRIDKLKAAICELEDASVALATSHCDAQQAIIQADEVVGWIAGTLENLSHLAGEPELAARIRACVR